MTAIAHLGGNERGSWARKRGWSKSGYVAVVIIIIIVIVAACGKAELYCCCGLPVFSHSCASGISPESHREFTRMSPEFHENFAGNSPEYRIELEHLQRGDNHNSAFPHCYGEIVIVVIVGAVTVVANIAIDTLTDNATVASPRLLLHDDMSCYCYRYPCYHHYCLRRPMGGARDLQALP